MRITYDEEADALSIILRDDLVLEDSTDLEDGVTAWLDGAGHVIGLEILDAGERLGTAGLTSVSLEGLPLSVGASANPSAARRMVRRRA